MGHSLQSTWGVAPPSLALRWLGLEALCARPRAQVKWHDEGGKMPDVEPTLQLLSVDDLVLDISNPRIAKWVEMYRNEPSADAMALALGAGSSEEEGGPSYEQLKQAILTSGGVIHPIIVSELLDDKYLVIEGNTRTVIYRSLKETTPDGRWDRILALVYPQLSAERVDAIRLQAHLVGTRPWDPYSKAKYLDRLRNHENLTFAQIVDYCGGNTREISQYIDAYHDMEKYYRPILGSDAEFDATRFSSFVELQGRVAEALIEAGCTKDDFARWVHTHRIYPQQMVRKLPRILQNPRAREAFLNEGVQAALRLLDVPPPSASLADATLKQLTWELVHRVNSLPFSEIVRLRRDADTDELDLLRDGRDALAELCDYITGESPLE